MTAYQLLGIEMSATRREIEAAYRRAVQILTLERAATRDEAPRRRLDDDRAQVEAAYQSLANRPARLPEIVDLRVADRDDPFAALEHVASGALV